jgi:hypothetical protein
MEISHSGPRCDRPGHKSASCKGRATGLTIIGVVDVLTCKKWNRGHYISHIADLKLVDLVCRKSMDIADSRCEGEVAWVPGKTSTTSQAWKWVGLSVVDVTVAKGREDAIVAGHLMVDTNIK